MYSFFENMYYPITEQTDISRVWGAYTRSWSNFSPASSPQIYNFGANKKKSTNLIFGASQYNFASRNSYSGGLFDYTPVYNFKSSKPTINKSYSYSANSFTYTPSKSVSKTENNKTSSFSKQNYSSKKNVKALNECIVNIASKYLGYNEADGTYLKFSDNTEWCADFVTHVVKEAYRKKGIPIPKGFGSWRTENIRQWAEDNGKLLQIARTANRAKTIKENVKPGDLMILRENGASHIGIVTHVNKKDGSFQTIEGNVPNSRGIDSVVQNSYRADEKRLTGFVQLEP